MAATDTQAVTPEPVMQAIQGYQVTGILKAGIDLAVFDAIAKGNSDPASIAGAIGADERATRILLDALAVIGFLQSDDGRFGLTPVADAFLVRERPTYLGSMVNIMDPGWLWDAFQRLPEAVRNGGTVLDQHAETPQNEWWETFARSIGGMATPAAEGLAAMLAPWAKGRQSLEVLDVACGNGKYSTAIAEQIDNAGITLLDWPNVLEITRGYVEEAGLGDRASYIEGSMFEVPLGGPYDLIITSHVFHHFSEKRCVELLRRLAEALKPDGRLAIQDFMAGDSAPAEEPFPRLFSVIMLVFTHEGEAYPVSAYERMLPEAGLRIAEVHQPPGAPSRFVFAERSS
jgi:2-polyprenyl-3-methyl-5-hydroxy-6-metoxy-1,4-benzoquinol methylase